jgi:hypothetical protein
MTLPGLLTGLATNNQPEILQEIVMATQLAQLDTDAASTSLLSFEEATRVRRSIRGFLDKAVPDSIIHEVLEDAQYAPSNCNTQPWNTHVVRGEKLKQLSQVLHAKNDAGEFTPDFSFDVNDFYGEYRERNNALTTKP